MPNAITKTTVLDGARNVVVLLNIAGDGSGEENNTNIFQRSSFSPNGTEIVVERVSGNLNGFTAFLSFDATTDLVFASCPATWFDFQFNQFGGLSSNKAGTGSAGDILLSTSGLGAGEKGTVLIEMRKS